MHHWSAEALRYAIDEGDREGLIAALLSGGDSRLRLDDGGRNKYFCRPRPNRSVVCLSSCTASPIDEAGFAAASAAYERIVAVPFGARAQRVAEERDGIVAAIGRYLGLDPSVEIVLTPSGTDGLLLAAALIAIETESGPLTAILPSPAETGSGVPQAVACRAVDGPEVGQPVVDRTVNVVSVTLRGPDGEALPPDRIAQDYRAACRAARGRPVIYLTHGTKTGLIVPVEVPAGFDVVVDACQLRLTPSAVRGYLARGWPVVITGSKFLGGPAFCGAVLLPRRRFSAAVRQRAEASAARRAAPGDADADFGAEIGPLLRWSAALATPGGRLPSENKTAARLKRLGEVAAQAVGSLPGVRLMQGGGPASGIVTFAVQKPDEPGAFMTADELRPLYRSLASQGVLLGQPVDLGPFGALRLAIGLRDVLRGSIDVSLCRLVQDWPVASGEGAPRARAGCAVPPRRAAPMEPGKPSESLDPGAWRSLRALGHRMLDDLFDDLQAVREGPVWRPMTESVRAAWYAPLPRTGADLAQVYDDYRRLVAPYGVGNRHPRFLGWVHGGGTAVGMLAEMLAAGLNANCGGRDHAPIEVERQVVRWAAEMLGLPEGAGGLLLSGTSMANLVAVVAARRATLGAAVREDGVGDARLAAYASEGAHMCVARAMDIAGIGSAALRLIPADEGGRLRVSELTARIAADRKAGLRPFMVIGTAGSVDTGAIDDLAGLAVTCRAEGLWFHVDAAFGAMAMLSDRLRPRLRGIEQADSVAFDFHKWAQVPYDAGCIVVRDEAALQAAFARRADYLRPGGRGLAAGEPWPVDLGPELSRGFRALKVWMTIRTFGADRLGAVVEQSCALARRLADAIAATAELELAAPVALNIVCFRVVACDDAGQERIAALLQEAGRVVLSTTSLAGRRVLRAAFVNHRTAEADVDLIVAEVLWAAAIVRESGISRSDSFGVYDAAGAFVSRSRMSQ